jgi:hypothetical protein
MRYIRLICLVMALAAWAVLTGCGSTGVGDILGGGSSSGGSTSDGRYDDRYDTVDNVRGTVERVDTVDRRIIVDREGTYDSRSNLRNGNEDDTVVLYYDDRTTVEHQGRSYRPQDLEPGDRILADVNETSGRLMVEDIEVLQDVSSNSTGYNDDLRATELRGTVSYLDTRERTLEIQTSGSSNFSSGSVGSTGRSGVVLVHYDANTTVEYQGRSYKPENLERGDEVEVEIRDVGGRLMAQEILVVRDSQGR